MPVEIISQVYRRRYDYVNRRATPAAEWVPTKTPGRNRLNQQQLQEFEQLCLRLGRPSQIQHYITGALPLTDL